MMGAEPQAGAADAGDVAVAWGCGLLPPGAAQAAASVPRAGAEDVDRTIELVQEIRAGRTVVMVEHNMNVV
ncbi:hypothetical protein, partial [Nonomuraea fuscirosea]|uniref:hypothetical protein n=1 Tax=Nonomuraea fuscirosea TaxID=1291556 RepID=UPI003F4E0AF8